ncbi:MAG: cell division protein FtsQ/DivIB [Nitritalea sp.]
MLKVITPLLAGLVLVGTMAFSWVRSQEQVLTRVSAEVEVLPEVYFLDAEAVLAHVGAVLPLVSGKTKAKEIDLHLLEQHLLAHDHVKAARVTLNPAGELHLWVRQHQPVARIVRSRAADAYLTDEGVLIPVSTRFSARVLTLSGPGAEALVNHDVSEEQVQPLAEFLKYVYQDSFWFSQLIHAHVDEQLELALYQQVGKQVIAFGTAELFEQKLEKVIVFYEEIAPKKGWNAYERVNVKFSNQIICE